MLDNRGYIQAVNQEAVWGGCYGYVSSDGRVIVRDFFLSPRFGLRRAAWLSFFNGVMREEERALQPGRRGFDSPQI